MSRSRAPASDRPHDKPPATHLRITLAPDVSIGPGKARLLEGIRDLGSIAAAGRRMGMSYKRAWLLVEQMNGAFETPVVSAAKGVIAAHR